VQLLQFDQVIFEVAYLCFQIFACVVNCLQLEITILPFKETFRVLNLFVSRFLYLFPRRRYHYEVVLDLVFEDLAHRVPCFCFVLLLRLRHFGFVVSSLVKVESDWPLRKSLEQAAWLCSFLLFYTVVAS